VELGSEEYNRIMLVSCEDMLQFAKDLREEIKRREKE
jgi:hypothetical protein